MTKSKGTTRSRSPLCFDPQKFEQIHQVGGIRTVTFDDPELSGSPGCRAAMVNTGSGLRFIVALDRGGDIVDAFHNHVSLAYLSPNGYKAPSHAFHRDTEWLQSWPGGLLTTCGPQYIGRPRDEDDQTVSLHGHHSNTGATVLAIHNPDLRSGDLDMHLDLAIRDTRMFGPTIEVRRRIGCTLGQAKIHLKDIVTNLGNTTTAHNWLYHVNPGYPLLDCGARLVYRGRVTGTWNRPAPGHEAGTGLDLKRLKEVPEPLPEHAGLGERGVLLDIEAGDDGVAHAGIVNRQRQLALELVFSTECLPRFANWQHFGPAGSYVTGLEPFNGSLMGKAEDHHPLAAQWLEPGERRDYEMTITVHNDDAGIERLLNNDGDLEN